MSSLSRYDDPVFALQYDLSEGERSHRGDIEFYVGALTALARADSRGEGEPGRARARERDGEAGTVRRREPRVLELGCGTGRITLPLARAGLLVVGLDNAPAVIDIARRKARAEGLAVEFRQGDAVEARLGETFLAAFMAYNTISLVENERVDALATNVAAHLTDGAHFLFDLTRMTRESFGPGGCRRVPWSEPARIAGLRVRRRMELRHRPEEERIDTVYFWEIARPDGAVERRTTVMPFSTWDAERYVDRFEAAGFTVCSVQDERFDGKAGERRDVRVDLLWPGA